jgi:phosphate transport system protein
MPADHILKRYDDELTHLNSSLIAMGGLAESQLQEAIYAISRRDSELAAEVVGRDAKVDELEQQVEEQVMRLLALRQPIAGDLREIVSSLKISADIERICDYAANIAKRSIALNHTPNVKPVHAISRMGKLAQTQIKNVIDAYIARDADKAMIVWSADEELDDVYTGLFRELLTYMMEDPRSITAGTHLLFIAKNIERIGDHVTNIAESIYFLVHGTPLKQTRPKRDRTSSAIVLPGITGVIENDRTEDDAE